MSQHRKVRFDLSASRVSPEWPPVDAEILLTTEDGPGTYELHTIPYYAYGVSMGDIVEAAEPDADGVLNYARTRHRGGHSTFRIRLKSRPGEDDRQFMLQMLTALKEFGCSADGDDHGVLAIDAPPECPVDAVTDMLELGESEGVWEYEKGHIFTADVDDRLDG